MTNHVYLLLSADRGEALGASMKALGQRYVQYYNRTLTGVAVRFGEGTIVPV